MRADVIGGVPSCPSPLHGEFEDFSRRALLGGHGLTNPSGATTPQHMKKFQKNLAIGQMFAQFTNQTGKHLSEN